MNEKLQDIEKQVADDLSKPRSRRTQIDLYADPAHVVYELLQNADDHGATQIHFNLEPDKLTVQHNATERFEEKHVRAILSFENSTSESNLAKTGKFGLGFKSVLAFTATPQVFSDNYCFEIYELFRLREIDKPCDLDPMDTRFIFHFNHMEILPDFIFEKDLKSAQMAYETIENKFRSLEACVLLFTPNLRRISFQSDTLKLKWSRAKKKHGVYETKSPNGCDRFRMYERPITFKEEMHPAVQLAIRLGDDGNPVAADIPLVVAFPTAISTGMELVLNGPFHTTPSREMIDQDDEFNMMLISESTELVKDLVREEKRRKRLSYDLIELLPFDSSRSACPALFEPLHRDLLEFAASTEMFPAANGGYVAGRSARIARSAYLADLFTDRQLTQLEGSKQPARWLPTNVGVSTTPRTYQAIEAIAKAQSGSGGNLDAALRPERLFSQMSETFLETQTAKWVCQLYATLSERGRNSEARKAAERKPILRLSNNKHVQLLLLGRPAAYLPSAGSGNYRTVSPTSVRLVAARPYLKDHGFGVPDLTAEVIDQIIPKYTVKSPDYVFLAHLEHLMKCVSAYRDGKASNQIVESLKSAKFIFAVNAVSGSSEFREPCECYYRYDFLSTYFDGYSDAWFVSPLYQDNSRFEEDIYDLFSKLGVNDGSPLETNAFSAREPVSIQNTRGHNERGLLGFHPDWTVAGLQNALATPNLNRSAIVWNEFLPSWEHRIEGSVQKSSKKDFPSAETRTEEVLSLAGKLLKDHAWIPNRSGDFLRAREFADDTSLHPSLLANRKLLAALNKGFQSRRDAAKTLAIENISSEKLEELRVQEDQRQEFEEYLECSAGSTPGRRAKVGPRSRQSQRRGRKPRIQIVRVHKISSDEIFRYLDTFYHFDERWRCQICHYPMPFHKRNKEEYCEKHELLSGRWATKRGYSLLLPMENEDEIVALPEEPMLHIVVCPTCNRIYQEYVATEDAEQDRLLNWIQEEDSTKFQIRCSTLNEDEPDRWIQFHRKHLDDIREVVSANLVKTETVTTNLNRRTTAKANNAKSH